MSIIVGRRKVLKSAVILPGAAAAVIYAGNSDSCAQKKVRRTGGPGIKISCNAYSYNSYLRSGDMTLDDLFDLCAELGFDAVDPTGYYFPGYPDIPDDEYIYHIKRKAFLLGLDISGTGVRNDFTNPDADKRGADVELVRKWMICASKLGAPVIRIFAGKGIPEGFTEEEVTGWVVEGIRACAEYGRQYGVMTAIQNHDEFLKTAGQLLRVLKMVDSEWVGLMVDTGSFSTKNAYEEIAKAAPYAITWQIKRLVTVNGRKERIDLERIIAILRNTGYRGYIPIEHIGEGDPKIIMPRFLNEVRQALG